MGITCLSGMEPSYSATEFCTLSATSPAAIITQTRNSRRGDLRGLEGSGNSVKVAQKTGREVDQEASSPLFWPAGRTGPSGLAGAAVLFLSL